MSQKLSYHSSSFNIRRSPSCITGWSDLDFTMFELLAAAISVGREDKFAVLANGIFSEYEIIYRIGIILANITPSPIGLKKTDAYNGLDPTEKGAVSYFIGMSIGKLMADKILRTPYLMHLEVYQDQIEALYGKIFTGHGKSRPDLIGLNNSSEWVVMEAKGRTNGFSNPLLNKAKRQARKIMSIGGLTPIVSVASVTYFENEILKVKWKDPKPLKEGMILNFVDKQDVLKKYYSPFLSLANDERSQNLNESGEIGIALPLVTIYIPKSIRILSGKNEVTEQQLDEMLFDIKTRVAIFNGQAEMSNQDFSIKRHLVRKSENVVMLGDGIRYVFDHRIREKFIK